MVIAILGVGGVIWGLYVLQSKLLKGAYIGEYRGYEGGYQEFRFYSSYRGHYRDPLPHSPLSTSQLLATEVGGCQIMVPFWISIRIRP